MATIISRSFDVPLIGLHYLLMNERMRHGSRRLPASAVAGDVRGANGKLKIKVVPMINKQGYGGAGWYFPAVRPVLNATAYSTADAHCHIIIDVRMARFGRYWATMIGASWLLGVVVLIMAPFARTWVAAIIGTGLILVASLFLVILTVAAAEAQYGHQLLDRWLERIKGAASAARPE